jgi:hypothetical protein
MNQRNGFLTINRKIRSGVRKWFTDVDPKLHSEASWEMAEMRRSAYWRSSPLPIRVGGDSNRLSQSVIQSLPIKIVAPRRVA